jgi:hypothetical protein
MDKGQLQKVVSYPPGQIGGEPVVIPKPGRTEAIYSNNEEQSYGTLSCTMVKTITIWL